MIFTGCSVAIVTPFTSNGDVDYPKFKELIEWQIEQGIDSITVCGTTGEASTLDDEEQIAVTQFCVDVVNKRVPVIAGAGSNDTRHGINLAMNLAKTGVDALLLVTPYYNKCSQQGLIEHFNITANAANIPCIIYSVKSRTGVNITPQTVLELSKNPNIVAIKEASGDISQCVDICRIVPSDFAIYSGNDDMLVPLMSIGGSGYISVLANIAPKECSEMAHAYLNGDINRAKNLQLSMKPLIDALFIDVNPIPVKAALHFLGKIELEYRLPLCKPSEDAMLKIKHEMQTLGLI